VRSAIALPSPVVDPPPSDTSTSAAASRAAFTARSVTSTGVCIAASVNTPALSAPSCCASAMALSFCCGVESTNARACFSARTSSPTRASVPDPKTTRWLSAS
jgi:hypothetical protein